MQIIKPSKFLFILFLQLLPFFACGQATEYILQKDTVPEPPPVPLMKKIENFALKDNLVSKLLRSVFIISSPSSAPPDTTRVSENPYKKHQDKIIRNIKIDVLDAFGYSVHKPVCYEITTLEKIGNRTHYRTRNWVIKNKLLFKENQAVSAFNLSESERLLRQSAYLVDSKIILLPVEGSADSVDAWVIVQDVWNLGVGASGDPLIPNADVEFTDINFMGLGQRFQSKLWYDERLYNKWKYSGSFIIPEIGNTYISGRIFYFTEERDQNYGLNFNRPFFSPVTPWAGGVYADVRKHFYVLATEGEIVEGYQDIWHQDVWAGYAFKPGPPKSLYQRKSQLFISGRVSNTRFANRDEFPTALRDELQNMFVHLFTVGYSFREYYKDRFIFGFGRTEDIPLGHLVSFTTGMQHTPVRSRFYNGIRASIGRQHSSLGYIFGLVEAGGFYHKKDVEEGVISTQFMYFTNMIPIRRWFIRQFLWTRFTLGYNRRPGELLNIDRGEGLRVFTSDRVRGTQKLVSNYEIDFFTPFTPLGFRIVTVLFADFALIGTKENPLLNSRLYQGYGIGLRLKNERLIFNTFQLSVHYYPGVATIGAREFRHFHTERPYYRFQGFEASAPGIAAY